MATIDFLQLFKGEHIFFAALESKKEKEKYDNPKDIPKPRLFPEDFDSCKHKLEELNNKGWGIFFVVNNINETKRRLKSNVTSCRAIWIDDDIVRDFPRDDFPLNPNIVVESSPGKYHYYWLTNTEDFESWDAVMATMVTEYGCDNSAKDLARVMRLPGFNHLKNKPFVAKHFVKHKTKYTWDDITKNFPPTFHKDKQGNKKAGEYKSQEDHINSIVTGENFHSSLQSVIANHANYTQSKQTLLQIARGLCAQALITGKLHESRVTRIKLMLSDDSIELEEMVNWAVDNTEAEHKIDIPDIVETGVERYELEYPPGPMGKLCLEIFEMAPHPNKEVAIMGGFALVAGIIGRKYNVLGMGLNLYIALLADSGIGKATIKNVINRVLLSSESNMMGSTYKGYSRFTGPKPIFEMLSNGLSRVCVLEEAGLMNLSTAGDQAGINRSLLDIYTSSGADEYAGGEGYSSKDSNIPVLRSPALTVAHVSTPKSYIKAMKNKDSTVSGEMARLWTLRSMGDKNLLNRDKREEFSEDINRRLLKLMNDCKDRQVDNDGKTGVIRNICVDKDIFNDSDEYTKLENKAKVNGSDLVRTILSRAFAKSLKIASIISVFNESEKDLDPEAYKWAKDEAIYKEIKHIEDCFSRESSDDIVLLSKMVGISILKCLHGKFKTGQMNADKKVAPRGIFTHSNITQVLRNNSQLKEIDDDPNGRNPRSGVQKVLDFMISNGYLNMIAARKMKLYGLTRAKNGYQITDAFNVFMDVK